MTFNISLYSFGPLPYELSSFENLLLYQGCSHNQKYKIKINSKLKSYITTCKGFVRDSEDSYTINYLLAVLIANWKEQGLIIHRAVHNTLTLFTIFGHVGPYFHFLKIRELVSRQLEIPAPLTFAECVADRKILFWCVSESTKKLIMSLIQCPDCNNTEAQQAEELFKTYCNPKPVPNSTVGK